MSHDDELVEQIRSQLHRQAGSVTTPPDVEQQVVSRARTIKRRQLLTQVLPVVGVAALASVTFGVVRSSDSNPAPSGASRSTGTTSPSSTGTTSPPSAAAVSGTDLPFVSAEPGGQGGPGEQFLTMNGRKVRLQVPSAWWFSNAVYRADDSVLLDMQETDNRFAVRARADGSIIKIDAFKPPFALSADGRLVAGLATGIANVINTNQRVVLVLVDAHSGKELARVEAGAPKRTVPVYPELIMDPGAKSVLVSDVLGDISVWSTARQLIEPLVLGGRGVQGSVAANPDRTLLLNTTDARDAARAEHENGRMTAWSWPDRAKVWTAPLVVDGPGSFSPDGRFVAVPWQGRVALLDASSGRLVRQTDVLPDYDPLRFPSRISISWEDASNFIAWDIGMDMNGRFRCAAATAACQPLNLGVGDARAVIAR